MGPQRSAALSLLSLTRGLLVSCSQPPGSHPFSWVAPVLLGRTRSPGSYLFSWVVPVLLGTGHTVPYGKYLFD